MSISLITLIPDKPGVIPKEQQRLAALKRLWEIVPDTDEIEIKVTEEIIFYDCGENFERILCPSCGKEISTVWWQEKMNEDYVNGGFKLAKFDVPCCNTSFNLHELEYEFPQGFGRFALKMMNPRIGKLEASHQQALENILSTKLRVIYQHL